MTIEKRECETCGEVTDCFVVFMCNNPSCDIPQHTVCIDDFLEITLAVREVMG